MPRRKDPVGGDIFHTLRRKYRNTIKDIKNPHIIKRKVRNTVKDVIHGVNVVNEFVEQNKRNEALYPPHIREFLSKKGDTIITSLVVDRTPLSNVVKNLMSTITLNQFDSAVSKSSYDELLHLSLFINNRYVLEKLEIVSIKEGRDANDKTESMVVPLHNKHISITELLDKTKKRMGDANFSNYNARTNNCQDFILNVLEANGLLTPPLRTFIKQDSEQVFHHLPIFTTKLAEFITDIGAVANKFIEGEGVKKNEWREFFTKKMKGKKFKNRDATNQYVKQLSVEYKKMKNKK